MSSVRQARWYRNLSAGTGARVIAAAGCAVLFVVGGTVSAGLRAQQSSETEAAAAGFYTREQAIRGKVQFNRHCAYCHTAEGGPMSEDAVKSRRGFAIGDVRTTINLGGQFLLRRFYDGHRLYPTVYYLFNRLESMPSNDVASIGQGTRTDIAAYLLEANGFPPGPKELPDNPQAMKAMPLDEPGFTPVFNGKDFTGIDFFLGPNCTPAPEGCGKIDPDPIFSVRDGVLVCSGRVHGYWYTEQRYLDFTLRFDFKYVPPPGWDGDDVIFGGQSGIHLFVTDHDIWPRAIEIQARNYDMLSVIAVSSRATSTDDVEARRRARKPLGEWNSIEIVSSNGEIRSSLNGVLISTVSEHEFTEPGHIAFESQGTEIQWRNVRIKPE